MKINETVGELLTGREGEMGIREPRYGVVSYLECKLQPWLGRHHAGTDERWNEKISAA